MSAMDDPAIIPLDAETKVVERPGDHQAELRLWLRLLTCTTLMKVRCAGVCATISRLRCRAFDLMAQLDKTPGA